MATNESNAIQRERQAEVNPLATKLAESFESYVRFYQDTYALSRKQAEKKARAGIRERQALVRLQLVQGQCP